MKKETKPVESPWWVFPALYLCFAWITFGFYIASVNKCIAEFTGYGTPEFQCDGGPVPWIVSLLWPVYWFGKSAEWFWT